MNNRTGKQVRERWLNTLDPNINHGPWDEKEDLQLIAWYHQFGSKWAKISHCLNNRSENMVKNRFYSYIKSHYDVEKLKIIPKKPKEEPQSSQGVKPKHGGLKKRRSESE